MNRSAVLIWAAALVLQGCSSEPSLLSGNKRGGIIVGANTSNQPAAANLASGHCRQYGEVARITVVDVQGNRVKFLCTER